MGVYYPAIAVKLVVRFDEALLKGQQGGVVSEAPTQVEGLTFGKQKTVTSSPGKLEGFTVVPKSAADMAESSEAPVAGGPEQQGAMFDDDGKNQLTKSLVIVPTSASVELSSYRQAPKFSMTFAWKDFPVDPRAIRSMAARIYIGVIPGSDFSAGMHGQAFFGTGDGRRLASQLALKPENLMLVGLVDNITNEHNDKGSSVTIDGRGIAGFLLDSKISAATLTKIDVNKPINEVVGQILGQWPQGKQIPVRIDKEEWPNKQIPMPASPDLLARDTKGQDGKKQSFNPMKADPNSVAYWDVITTYCNVVGAIPYFIADELWIRPVKSIYDQKNAGIKGDTPFQDGKTRNIKLADGKTIDANFRKMIYGRNLQSWKLERKFGGVTVPWVRTVALDMSKDAKKRLVFGDWPPISKQEQAASAVDPSGKQARGEALRIPVNGIVDQERLTVIAQNIYNEIGRGELGGSASTKDLASLGGDNADADIIRLRPGDAVEFAVDASGLNAYPPVTNALTTEAARAPGEAVQDLQDRLGLDKKLAEVLVGSARGKYQALQTVFRVANVKYTWAIATGIAVDFDFQNYITARFDFDVEKDLQLEELTITETSSFGSSTEHLDITVNSPTGLTRK